jgi:single-stranded DNA-specific DHH superfamily exonuclease
MITGCLQKKNGYYYAVLYPMVNGKRKTKWVSTKLPVSTTSERKAQRALDEIRMQYELQNEERTKLEAEEAAKSNRLPPEAQVLFVDYMETWLNSVRSSIATAIYQSYSIMMKARVIPYFTASAIPLGVLTPQDIEAFYQSILNDGCTPTP